MTDAVNIPSAREQIFLTDPRTGHQSFTRSWFLFFQEMWRRTGGAASNGGDDAMLAAAMAAGGGGGDQDALQAAWLVTAAAAAVPQGSPDGDVRLDLLAADVEALRGRLADLEGTLQGVRSGLFVT